MPVSGTLESVGAEQQDDHKRAITYRGRPSKALRLRVAAARSVCSIGSTRSREARPKADRPTSFTTFALVKAPAPVAQRIERRFPKPCVAGSSPAWGANSASPGSEGQEQGTARNTRTPGTARHTGGETGEREPGDERARGQSASGRKKAGTDAGHSLFVSSDIVYPFGRSTFTGGRSSTSCLVMLSRIPSSTRVTALIGIATSLRPHTCPSWRSTWVTW